MRVLMLWAIALMGSHSFGQTTEPNTWLTNLPTAQAQAAENEMAILMVFAGSDWCKPCILLRRNIFDSQEFQEYATDNLVLLELDFPAQRKNRLSEAQTSHNEALAERFNPKGAFPLAVIISHEEQVMGTFDYSPSQNTESYIEYIQSKISNAQP